MSEHSDALKRVRAYLEAVPTLYDDKNPMPDDCTVDTATNWDNPENLIVPRSFDLLYADLVLLLGEGGVHSRDAMKRAFCAGAILAGGVSNNEKVDKAFHQFMLKENIDA